MCGVLGFLQTSLDHWEVMGDEDRHSAVRRAFTNARRLQAMTRDVLDTESIESGRFGYVRHPIDLADEVRTAVDAFSSGMPGGVVLTVPDTPVMLVVDPDRIQRVLENLLDNARKNAPSELPIEVSLEQTENVARLVVEDHGGRDRSSASDKFVAASTVTGRSGLHLRRIVDAMRVASGGEPPGRVDEVHCRTALPGPGPELG